MSQGGTPNAVQACPVCQGRGSMPAGFFTGLPHTNSETCRVCTGGGLLWIASGQPVRDNRNEGTGRGTEYVGPLGEYIAANLREVLRVIPDTGDWHSIVRQACEKALEGSKLVPNHTADWYREQIGEGRHGF